MKYLITLSIILTSLYSTASFATCNQKDKLLFSCEIQKSKKILEVCDQGKTISYSLGKKNKQPELLLKIPREKALFYRSGETNPTESFSITIPHEKTEYRVFRHVDKTSKEYPVTSGVIVEVEENEVANLTCINKTVIHNLMWFELKPDEENKKIKGVKGPVFSADIILSNAAKEKMELLKEKIIISSLFSGERSEPLKNAVDSDDPNLINLMDTEVEINLNEIAHFDAIYFEKEKVDKIKPNFEGEREYELTINVYSARKGHKDNLLSCSTLIEADARILNNKHVRLWCSLIDESISAQQAKVMGKAKLEYENTLQACTHKHKVINNNILDDCILKIADKFKGTETNDPDALKLEGLVDTVGRYERKNDSWNFSLDETAGFYLNHMKSGEKDEVFLADRLEHISGNRYVIYAKSEGVKNDNDALYSWALIYNLKTKHYDLEVKTYDKTAKKWKYLTYLAVQ